jgi:hypothetical protein
MKKILTRKIFSTLSLSFFVFASSSGQSISGSTDVCFNSLTEYTAKDLPSGSTANYWSVTNGTVFSGQNTSTVTIQWNGTGAASISFSYNLKDANGVDNSYTVPPKDDITVFGIGFMTATATPASICQGESSILGTSFSGSLEPYTYFWSDGSTSSDITVSPSLGTTYYSVTAIDKCNNSYSQTVSVTVNAVPVITTTSNPSAAVCPGSSATLTANGATSYTWSPSTGLNVTTGSTVIATPSATTIYRATGSNGFCTASNNIMVTVAPSVTVSSAVKICPGGSTTLTAGGATTYIWSPSTGLNQTTGSTVVASPAATTTYTVSGVLNGCTTSKQVTVTVLPIPVVPIIAGPTNYCINPPNQTFNVPVGNTPGATYTWSISPSLGTFVGSNIGPTTTIDFNNLFTGVGTLSLAISNQCGSSTGSVNLYIDPSIAATPAIFGSSSVCNVVGSFSSYSLGHMVAGAVWEVTPTNAVASSTTSPYGPLNVFWNADFIGTAYLRVKIQNGCGSSAWSPIYVVNVDQKNHPILGPSSVCNGGAVSSFSLGKMTAGTVWSVTPANAVASSSPLASPYGMFNVDWNDNFVGTVNVNVTFPTGCGTGPWSSTKIVSVGAGTCRFGLPDQEPAATEALQVLLYPNPTDNEVNLVFHNSASDKVSIQVIDTKGALVYKNDEVSTESIFLLGAGLPAGMYIVKIFNGQNREIIKFCKQ